MINLLRVSGLAAKTAVYQPTVAAHKLRSTLDISQPDLGRFRSRGRVMFLAGVALSLVPAAQIDGAVRRVAHDNLAFMGCGLFMSALRGATVVPTDFALRTAIALGVLTLHLLGHVTDRQELT